MSNAVTIIPTKFEDVRTGDIGFGYRIFDAYADSYSNAWESVPDDNMEFLNLVLKEAVDNFSEVVLDMFHFIWENETGISVDGVFYDFEDIKEVLAGYFE